MRDGFVTKEELLAILDEQRDTRLQRITGRRLGEILIERGVVTPIQVARLVAEQYELPFIELAPDNVDPLLAGLMSEDQALHFSALPINRRADGTLLLAIADPSTVVFSEQLRQILGSVPHFAVAGQDAIDAAIASVYSRPLVTTQPTTGLVSDLDEAEPVAEGDSFTSTRTVARLWPPLGALLIRDGLLTDAELEATLAQQRLSTSRRLGEILVERGVVPPAAVARLVAEQYELSYVDLDEHEVDGSIVRALPREMACAYRAVPIEQREDGSLAVAIADPTNVFYSDDLHTALEAPVTFLVATPDAIDAVIAQAWAQPLPEYGAEAIAGMPPAVEPDAVLDEVVPEDMLALDADEPVLDPTEDLSVYEIDDVVVRDETMEPAVDVADELVPVPTEELAPPPPDDDTVDELVADAVEDAVLREVVAEDMLPLDTDEPVFDPTEGLVVHEIDDVFVRDETMEPAVGVDDALVLGETDELVPFPTEELAPPSPHEETVDEPVMEDAVEASDATPSDLATSVGEALADSASVIHVSHADDRVLVRARFADGLRVIGTYADDHLQALVDECVDDRSLEVNVLPTARGSKITMLRRARPAAPRPLDELGLDGDRLEALRESLEQPGLTVVSGPPKSGVTTTLYALLRALTTSDRVVVTLERRIECPLEGADQVEIGPATGLTPAGGLSLMRKADSDVVLVDATLDPEAAAAAVHLALEGRHVLVGTRAAETASAVLALRNFGVDPDALASALRCVVSQRIVRTLCPHCRATYYASPEDVAALGLDSGEHSRLLARSRGCESCAGTGFAESRAIFEVLRITDELRPLVATASETDLDAAAVEAGMTALEESAVRLCLDGLTTPAELERVFSASSL